MGPVTMTSNLDWRLRFGMVLVASAVLVGPGAAQAGQAAGASDHDDVTFTKDIAPILQRSCQHCHQPDSVAPMSHMILTVAGNTPAKNPTRPA